jgi:hypothetical protein
MHALTNSRDQPVGTRSAPGFVTLPLRLGCSRRSRKVFHRCEAPRAKPISNCALTRGANQAEHALAVRAADKHDAGYCARLEGPTVHRSGEAVLVDGNGTDGSRSDRTRRLKGLRFGPASDFSIRFDRR